MLCYGGLVASRTPQVDLQLAMDRLSVLHGLRQNRPDLVIYAFSTITRLGTTVASAADLERHELLRAYSQLVDRRRRLGEESARAELDAVLARLDRSALDAYLAVRRRNHAINRAAIQLLADGILDYLVLAQEDAAPVGLHVPEQLALRDHAAELRATERVAIHPGADEVGLVLTARHCLDAAGSRVGIAADYPADAGADVIPQFENHPVRETVESQILAAGARPAAPSDADAILFVHTPRTRQPHITEAPPPGHAPALALQAADISERIRAAKAAGRIAGLADLAYCNGADPELIAALQAAPAGRDLDAVAAWNTAANALGTVVSHLCLLAAAHPEESSPARAASDRFLLCRLADDYAYQSCVRQQAVRRATEMGADPYALGGAWPDLQRSVSAELEPLAHAVYSDLRARPEAAPLGKIAASLPWHRLFEVEVELTR